MNDAARRWAVGIVRHQPTTAADLKEFLKWAAAAVRHARSLPHYANKPWPFITIEDYEDLAAEYGARLSSEGFRQHWASLPDADTQRLVNDDIYGKPGRDNNWLDKMIKQKLAEGRRSQLPASKNDEGEAMDERDPDAVRHYRSDPDAVMRNDSPPEFNELPCGSDHEAILLTFKRCLSEFRLREWPAAWSAEKGYAAHVLLWYRRIRPKYDDLKDYQLAHVLGISPKVASTILSAAHAVWIPYTEQPADGVPEYSVLFYEIRLTALLKST